MKVKLSSTTFLVVCFSLLVAWYALYEKQIKVKQTTEEQNLKRLTSFSKDDIQDLEIATSADAVFKLKRSGSEWLLVSPVEDTADSGVINSLLTTLTTSEQERVIEENPTDLAVFGLEKPGLVLKLSKDAQTTQEIFVGNQTQVGSSVYAKTSSGKQVFKVNRSLLSSFQKNLFELRNKNLVSIKRSDLTELDILNPSGQIIVNRTSDDKWVLGREGGSPVDSIEWGKILNTVVDLKAIGVASEKPEIHTFNLDKPVVKVSLYSGADKPSTAIFLSKANGKFYAKRDDKPFIYEINKEALEDLSKNASHLKDLHLVSFNRFAVSKISLSRGALALQLKKEGPVWGFIDAKADRKLDPGKVEKFLTQLQDSKATAFSSDKKNKTPSVVIEVFEKQNEKEVSVAKLEFYEQKDGSVFGRSNYQKGFWTVTRDGFKQLNLTQEDFLEPVSQKPEEKKS